MLLLVTNAYAGPEYPLVENESFKYQDVILSGPLDRTAPYPSLNPGSTQELINMVRPVSGSIGWKTRSGTTKHNTDPIASEEIESLHDFYNKDSSTQNLIAQCNDNMYLATSYPATSGTSFASTSLYSLNSSVGTVFSATVGNDCIFAASAETPFIYSGVGYPDEVLIDRNSGNTLYQSGWDSVRNNDTSRYLDFVTGQTDYAYIISHKRLDTIYLDFVTGSTNSVASGATVYTRRSGAWVGVSSLTDGTDDDSGTTTFYQSGSLSWTYSNLDDTYILPNTNHHGYIYRVSGVTNLSTGIKVYRVRTDGDCQPLTPLWNSIWIPATGAYKSTVTGYEDYSADVVDGSEYSYLDMAGVTSMFVGFPYPMTAVYLQVSSDNNNVAVQGGVSVYYWNGGSTAFTSVGTVSDSTSDNGYSATRSGLIQWDGSEIYEDYRNFGAIPVQMYWYEIRWQRAFGSDDTVYIWDVGGANKPKRLSQYNGVASYNGRAVFWPGEYYKNGLDYSAEGKGWILNGSDAGMTGGIFGSGEVNAFKQLYSYGILSTKNPPGLFVYEGKIPTKFDELRLTSDKGVVAPHSMVIVEDAVKLFNQNRSVHAVIFLSHEGVYMTDGQVVMNISQVIKDYWDTNSAPYIEPSYAKISWAWVDYIENTVHFTVPVNTTGTGTQTTCNYELVYNYLTGEWYDRHIRENAMSCGISLIGSDDGRYAYTGDYSGTVYRTGYGTNDWGNNIQSYLITSDFNPAGKLSLSSEYKELSVKAKAQTSGMIDVFLYPDGVSSPFAPSGITQISLVNSGSGYINQKGSGINLSGRIAESMAFKFESGVTNEETLEIYGFTIQSRPTRQSWEE